MSTPPSALKDDAERPGLAGRLLGPAGPPLAAALGHPPGQVTRVPHAGWLPGGMLARRILLAGAYAVLTVLLARAVAADIDGVELALEGLGGVLPDAIQRLGPSPQSLALAAIGFMAFSLAGGSYFISRESGGAFALLAVVTAGWFLFPYTEVPWATVFTGTPQAALAPPAGTWAIAGLIVAIATIEVALSARDTLVRALATRGLPEPMVADASRASRNASAALLASALALGGAVAILYALLRKPLATGLIPDPHLIWVPAAVGLVAAVLVWWVSRMR